VSAAFHDQTQPVLAREVYGCGNVVGISCGNGINTGLGSPRIRPAQGLRESRLVADVKGIIQVF
jgi:hypothetical protein